MHAGHSGHDKHAGHDPEMFRRRFWLILLLSIPRGRDERDGHGLVRLRADSGVEWVGPVLGSVVFFWGGWPFLDRGRGTRFGSGNPG